MINSFHTVETDLLKLALPKATSPRAYRAWPLAWPSPSGPLGWQRSPGSTARRRRVPRSGMRSTVEAGGASPDNARRSGPRRCDIFTATGALWRERDGLVVVLAGAAAGYGGDRRRPVTGGAVRGSRRAVGLASEGRGEAAAPQRRDPRVNPGRLRRVTLAAHFLSTARVRPRYSRPGPSGSARRRCALELRIETCNSIARTHREDPAGPGGCRAHIAQAKAVS